MEVRKRMLRNIVHLGGRLLIICMVAGALLSLTYSVTAPVKAANDALKAQQALAAVYPQASEFTAVEGDDFDRIHEQYSAVTAMNRASDGGVIVTLNSMGYHSFSVMVGLDPTGTVTGYQVLSHTETAGLGDGITKESFSGQFAGKKAPLTLNQDVQAISGATKSSRGVVNAVNMAAEAAAMLTGE